MAITTKLKKIDALKLELDALRPIDKEQEQRILQKFRLDWNFNSNHIEGNSLTYGETKALLLHGITADGKPLRDHFEIKGHNEAILLVQEVIKQERPLTEKFIRELHEVILKEPYTVPAVTPDGKPTTKTIKIGEYKSTANHVKTATGEIFYFATPEETPAKMNDLMDWLRSTIEKNEEHRLVVAAEFHYRFIRIHPFDDGNGRMARILMNFILMQAGYPPVIIKVQDKEEKYFPALRQADGNNLTPFFEFMADQLVHSLELMILGAKGEDIEDLDDVDKEIALFKAGFGDETFDLLDVLNKNDRDTLLHHAILPILEKVLLSLDSFESLFNTKRITLSYSYRDSVILSTEKSKDNIVKYDVDLFKSIEVLLNGNFYVFQDKGEVPVILKYQLLGLKSKIDKPKSIELDISIHINRFGLKLEHRYQKANHSGHILLVESTYSNVLLNTEDVFLALKRGLSHLKKEVLREIKEDN